MLKPGSGGLTGQVRVGATHTFNIGLIPECVALFLARHPTVRVRVEELAADQIGEKLHAGELDLGIAYRPSGPTDLWFEPLYNEEMVLVVVDAAIRSPAASASAWSSCTSSGWCCCPSTSPPAPCSTSASRRAAPSRSSSPRCSTIAPMLGLVLRMEIGAIVGDQCGAGGDERPGDDPDREPDADPHAGPALAPRDQARRRRCSRSR